MNWGDIGTKAHPKERLDSLMSQLPMRRTGGATPITVGAMILAGVSAVARADDPETPGNPWTARYRDSSLVISLATCEVMAIVVLVFVLMIAFSALRCWSYTCMRRRPCAIVAQAGVDIDSGVASAARGVERRSLGAVQDTPGGPGRREQPMLAARAESADEALAVQAGRTAVLDRCILKALQQKCMDLHIEIGRNKEEVVRTIATHMTGQDCVQLAASGATLDSLGMSQYFVSEGYAEGKPSSDEEDLAAERQAHRHTNGTDTG